MGNVVEEVSQYLDNLDKNDDYNKLSISNKIKHLIDLKQYVLSYKNVNINEKDKVKVLTLPDSK